MQRSTTSALPSFARALLQHLSAATGAEHAALSLDGDELTSVFSVDPDSGGGFEAALADRGGGAEGDLVHRFRLRACSGTLLLRPVDDERLTETLRVIEEALPLLGLVTELETARREAAHDPLTGLLNRRALTRAVGRALALSSRHGTQPFSLSMLDLDHFKWFNDSFGHSAGDDLLREIARVIQGSTRGSDLAARWGGDEFLLMLPETSPDEAAALLERLSADLRLFLQPYERDGLSLGFSAGISHHPADGDDMDTLVRRADERLYADKRRHDVSAP